MLHKWILAAMGSMVGYFAPTGWLMLVCILMVLYDAYTAYSLATRVKQKYPALAEGKFKSNAGLKAIRKVRDILIVIVLSYLIEDKVIVMFDFHLPYIVAAAFCFTEAWSILENRSSCNNSKWAKVLQKIMVDKTARHFDIPVETLENILNEKTADDITAGNGSVQGA